MLAGHALDILSRAPLWREGLDYRHGTGHGIGSYLNVHEGLTNVLSLYYLSSSNFMAALK
jgi:Xaa-Pro aminopeptidase